MAGLKKAADGFGRLYIGSRIYTERGKDSLRYIYANFDRCQIRKPYAIGIVCCLQLADSECQTGLSHATRPDKRHHAGGLQRGANAILLLATPDK